MTYEIHVNGRWAEVDRHIFRSWSGQRRIDDVGFEGPVYVLGTDVEREWDVRLGLVFGDEWEQLEYAERAVIQRDCMAPPVVEDLKAYARMIGAGNLKSYVACRLVGERVAEMRRQRA